MRNLSDFIIENSEYKNLLYDRENLLIWETECNSNEIVIAELAKYLKM
jgi:ubiquitin thioesterase protein OTUB2